LGINLNKKDEYGNFDRTMRDLLKVSHAEIKARLDEERAQKKRKKATQSSASGRVANDKD